MKINDLNENTIGSVGPTDTQAPKFGRSDTTLESSVGATASGSVATGTPSNLGVQRRNGKKSIFQGIKTSKKFVNSAPVKESKELSEREYKKVETPVKTEICKYCKRPLDKCLCSQRESVEQELDENDPCWKDYKQIGMKKKGNKQVPNCVPKEGVAEAYDHNAPFDAREFEKHMAKLKAREELRKTDPMKAVVADLVDQDKEKERLAQRKKPEDDSIPLHDPRHPGYAHSQFNPLSPLNPFNKVDEDSLNEFAPNDNGDRPKFIPWKDFIEGVKGIVGKDFGVVENIVKTTIKAKFVPHDPMEYGPTMLYSYYEARRGRPKGAFSTRGAIQVGKYIPNTTGLGDNKVITAFKMLKGHPFERHFDLTPENIYKVAEIIMGNTEGAYQMQSQGVAEGSVQDELYQRQQELRKKRGAPDPMYYKELEQSYNIENDQERYARQAEIRKKYGITEGDDMVLEKSKSKAQFKFMAAAAHNPKFAKKAGMDVDVAKEFHKADKKQSYKKLPDRSDETVTEADLSEEQLLAKQLKKQLELFKKGQDHDLGGKPKDHELGKKPTDKEILTKDKKSYKKGK